MNGGFFLARTKELVRRLNSLFEPTNFEVAVYSAVSNKSKVIVCRTADEVEGARGKAFTHKPRTKLINYL